MPKIIILDSGPLSNSVIPLAKLSAVPTVSQHCRQWLLDCERAGVLLIVPAIAYYETLRELELREAKKKIERLKEFALAPMDRFLSLTTSQLELAAKLWGQVRRAGMPTAADAALDADVILAAQVQSLGLAPTDFIVATTNVGHLSRFVPCDEGTSIKPEVS